VAQRVSGVSKVPVLLIKPWLIIYQAIQSQLIGARQWLL
jgi:hypothetical protein